MVAVAFYVRILPAGGPPPPYFAGVRHCSSQRVHNSTIIHSRESTVLETVDCLTTVLHCTYLQPLNLVFSFHAKYTKYQPNTTLTDRQGVESTAASPKGDTSHTALLIILPTHTQRSIEKLSSSSIVR